MLLNIYYAQLTKPSIRVCSRVYEIIRTHTAVTFHSADSTNRAGYSKCSLALPPHSFSSDSLQFVHMVNGELSYTYI